MKTAIEAASTATRPLPRPDLGIQSLCCAVRLSICEVVGHGLGRVSLRSGFLGDGTAQLHERDDDRNSTARKSRLRPNRDRALALAGWTLRHCSFAQRVLVGSSLRCIQIALTHNAPTGGDAGSGVFKEEDGEQGEQIVDREHEEVLRALIRLAALGWAVTVDEDSEPDEAARPCATETAR